MSGENFDSKVIQKNVVTKETVEQQNNMLVGVRASFSDIRQGITRFMELMMESNNVLEKVKEQVVLSEGKLLELENSIQEELKHFVTNEISDAITEVKISAEQSDSKVMEKDVSTKDALKQQKNILAEIRTSFDCIGQGVPDFEELVNKSNYMLQKVKEQVDSAENFFSKLENSIQKQQEHIVVAEISEASLEEIPSVEKFDSNDM